jgi:hypothetical protein
MVTALRTSIGPLRRLEREQHLEEILSVRAGRRVAEDHTVSWDGNRWGYSGKKFVRGFVERR